MSIACPSAARVSAVFVRSGPQPAFCRSLLVSSRTWASGAPVLGGAGVVVDGVLVGVLVGLGLGDVRVGKGVRVARRLGAVLVRVGVGFFDGVRLGVAEGFGVSTDNFTGVDA